MVAFSSTVHGRPKSIGHIRMSYGRFDATVDGGDIDTNLRMCHCMMLTHEGSAVEASMACINETLPVDGSAVSVFTADDDTGYWLAFGY
jgi:hypothetical protein